MAPSAKYCEAGIDGRRTYLLLPDRVSITGSNIRGDFDVSVDLSSLSRISSRLRVRSRYFSLGFLLILLPWLLIGVAATVVRNPTLNQFLMWPIGISICGFIMAVCTVRKVDHVQFATEAGIVVLDIARAGKDASNFDLFTELISKQIVTAKKNSDAAA